MPGLVTKIMDDITKMWYTYDNAMLVVPQALCIMKVIRQPRNRQPGNNVSAFHGTRVPMIQIPCRYLTM